MFVRIHTTRAKLKESMTTPGFFKFSYSVFILYPYLFLRLYCPAFCLFVFRTQTSMPPAGFFLYFICTSLSSLSSACLLFFTVQHTQHNTNVHAPGGIRTHNSSKRSAADPRLRPLGHWDRQGFEPIYFSSKRHLYRALTY